MSDEEKAKLDVTYTFASFWTATTQARQAIFDQEWSENGQIKKAAGDTLPVVTGDLYDEQMEIWNSLDAHKVYKTKKDGTKFLKSLKREAVGITLIKHGTPQLQKTVNQKPRFMNGLTVDRKV